MLGNQGVGSNTDNGRRVAARIDLLRGKIDKFSLDALVIMLNRAGMHVEMRVRKAA